MEARPNPGPHGRWCDQHKRWECAKHKHGGGTCHGSAITGTDACRIHVGKTVAVARRDALTAWAAVPDDTGISPRAAVAAQLGLSWRRAELLAEALRQQVEAGNGDGGEGGLVGHTYSASAAAGGVYPVSERARALVELEAAERDRIVRFAETGHRMGIEDARISLADQQARMIRDVLELAAHRLGLDVSDPDVRLAVRDSILELALDSEGS